MGAPVGKAMLFYRMLAVILVGTGPGLRWVTGRWWATAILALGVVGVLVALAVDSYLSPESRERRRVADLHQDVGAALDLDSGVAIWALRLGRDGLCHRTAPVRG